MFSSLIPDPLHPAVVHFPIVLAVLLPLVMAWAVVAIRRGRPVRGSWGLVLGFVALLTLSALVAKETGEDQEERVEEVVAREALHAHEEAADRFVLVVLAVLTASAVGLRRDGIGTAARLVATVGSLGVLAAGWSVGEAGGKLVYQHGAASAYVSPPAPGPARDD